MVADSNINGWGMPVVVKTNTLRHAAAASSHRPVRTMDNVILNLSAGYTVSAGKPTPRSRHKFCGRS